MKALSTLSMVCLLVVTLPRVFAQAVSIETVTVGNPGNAPDTRYETPGYGAVGYTYKIGKYEVTAAQYTEFLNAVARTDAYGLYNPSMGSSRSGCKIERSGSPGSYTYSVAADRANRPVNYVSWGDAARFANWLHNGQPNSGAQDFATTEDGSYYLNGATSDAQLLAVTRKPSATWVIPSEDEWYKTAYHKNDGITGNYWDYPTGTNSVPSNVVTYPDSGNNANFFDMHSQTWCIGPPYYATPVGEFENSESPYGTFDQGGNVFEWNEAIRNGTQRGARGGVYGYTEHWMSAAMRTSYDPAIEVGDGLGFRLARLAAPPLTSPTITQHPAAASACPAGTAQFTVTATSGGTLTYQWQKNQANLSAGAHYSGVTTTTLIVSSADASDVAGYRCVVTNEMGSATSTEGALTLKTPTTITAQPAAQNVGRDGTASFTVVATGDGTPSYQWQKDAANLSDDSRIAGATTATLTISSVVQNDAGYYRCIVTAGCGNATSATARLRVIVPLSKATDFDGDSDVDLGDFLFFQMCFSGPNRPSPYPECDAADFDHDNDVDLADFLTFQACFNGPNKSPACP